MRKSRLLYSLLLLSNTFLFASPRVFPTGVTVYDPIKAYNSYVLFAGPDNITHLIDMNGNDVHQWQYPGQPSELLNPAVTGGKLGRVLLQLENGKASFDNKVIGEVDWDGNILWQWGKQAPGGAARQHHDWYRLPNGNTVVLVQVKSVLLGYENVTDDALYEVTPAGDIVWKWIASEHLKEFGLSKEGIAYLKQRLAKSKESGRSLDYLHINDMQVIGENQWYRKGDQRFNPDNIVFDSRNANFIAIIEKSTGKIVWRLGPNFPDAKILLGKEKGPRKVDQIAGQHDAHIIPEGLPGAGNLLVFDNQGSAGYPPVDVRSTSRVLEINPLTQEIVWEYHGSLSGRTDRTFFSSYISSARRLPNGNTLIDEGMNGRFFQVTPSGEIVWEYVSPYNGKGRPGVFDNWVYRAQPVPYEWVPEGTPRSEKAVKEIDLSSYHLPLL